MGKKAISQQASSSKTSKNEKQLHSLIKVLRPKVYITDSSSFKQLVQELTGYRSQTSSTPKPEQVHQKVPAVIEINEDQGETPAAAATTTSMDSSLGSFELWDVDQAFQLEEINQLSSLIQTADNMISTSDHASLANQQTADENWLAYQNLESWLLDAEPYYSCYNGGSSTQNEQEFSLFDYGLSGLI